MSSLSLNPRDVQRAIRLLEGLDAKRASISDYEQNLTPLFRGYRATVLRLHQGTHVYRGRKCEKPNNLEDIGNRPAKCVVELGRANNIGESIFYGAMVKAVPFFELDVQPGDHISLSDWKTTEPIILNHVGFSSEIESYEDSVRNLDLVHDFVEDTKAVGDLNSLVYDYLAYNFSRPMQEAGYDHYKFTNAISRKLFGADMMDGLLYPTIKMFGNADNIALKGNVAKRALRFVGVQYYAVKAVRGMEIVADVLDSAAQADSNGILAWSGRNLQWEGRDVGDQLSFRVEGGQWVAYDAQGNRVDPV